MSGWQKEKAATLAFVSKRVVGCWLLATLQCWSSTLRYIHTQLRVGGY